MFLDFGFPLYTRVNNMMFYMNSNKYIFFVISICAENEKISQTLSFNCCFFFTHEV